MSVLVSWVMALLLYLGDLTPVSCASPVVGGDIHRPPDRSEGSPEPVLFRCRSGGDQNLAAQPRELGRPGPSPSKPRRPRTAEP